MMRYTLPSAKNGATWNKQIYKNIRRQDEGGILTTNRIILSANLVFFFPHMMEIFFPHMTDAYGGHF